MRRPGLCWCSHVRYLDIAIKREPENPLPHMIKAISLVGLGNPMAMLLGVLGGGKGNSAEAAKEFAEAERLMIGKPEYADILPEIRQMKQVFSGGGLSALGGLGGLLGGLGPPPFFDDDDFDDDFDEFDDDFDDVGIGGFFRWGGGGRRESRR